MPCSLGELSIIAEDSLGEGWLTVLQQVGIAMVVIGVGFLVGAIVLRLTWARRVPHQQRHVSARMYDGS
jgi:hypothetical protein